MKLLFNLSSERIQEAVKEGIVLKGKMSIDVDLESLSDSDREILSRNISYIHAEDAFRLNPLSGYRDNYRTTQNTVSSESISGIIAEMKKLEDARSAYIENEKRQDEIKSEIDEILLGINDPMFVVDRYDNDLLYFNAQGSDFKRQYRVSNSVHAKIEKMLEFVKSDQLLAKLNEIKAEYKKMIQEYADKVAAEAARKAELEAGRTALVAWAKENGSDLLKLRIKHEQNWQSLAEREWAKAHVVGDFEPWSFEPDSNKDWTVMNASLEQLQNLEEAQTKNPDHEIDIIRSRWDDDDEYPTHRTFLRCRVKTPTGYELLYSEIADASDE